MAPRGVTRALVAAPSGRGPFQLHTDSAHHFGGVLSGGGDEGRAVAVEFLDCFGATVDSDDDDVISASRLFHGQYGAESGGIVHAEDALNVGGGGEHVRGHRQA